MKTWKYFLFLGFTPLLASMKAPAKQHKGALSDNNTNLMQYLVPECYGQQYLHNENESPRRQRVSFRQLTRFSKEENEDLTKLLLDIVKAELSQCILGIVWDSAFTGSTIIDRLSLLPNVKQVSTMEMD